VNSFFGEVNLLLVDEALEAAIEISGGFECFSHRKLKLPQLPEDLNISATNKKTTKAKSNCGFK
jgi:hypothetical protein